MSMTPQLMSGGRGKIKITGTDGVERVLAIATDISINVRHDVRPSFVVGEMQPVSLDPTGYDVDCSIGRLIPVNTPDKPTASAPKPEDYAKYGATPIANQATGITANALKLEEDIADMLTQTSLTIVIEDKVTQKVLVSIQGCRFTGKSLSLGTGDIGQERYNFVGIYDAANNNSATTGYTNA